MATRDEIIEKARDDLVKFYETQAPKFARDLERIIGKGIFDLATIKQELTALGWDGIIVQSMGKFDELFKLSENMFKAGEIPFLWTAQNEALFGEMLRAKATNLINLQKGKFAADMVDFAFQSKLSGKTTKDIIAEATERFAQEGRRIGTEVDTALSSFDAASKSMLYENAGVERFIYVGPYDKVTRDVCLDALSSDYQITGWTREDIANFPGIDFITRGGYNCRHRFEKFDPELATISRKLVETAEEF